MSDQGLLTTMDTMNDEMIPQWKKELIQRRKNLAKTIGATVNMVSMLPSTSSSSISLSSASSSSSSTPVLQNGSKICSGSKDYHQHTININSGGNGATSSQNSTSCSSNRITSHAIPQTLAQKKIIGGHSHHINFSMYNSTTPLNTNTIEYNTTTTTNNELITENKFQLHSSNGCERFGVNYDNNIKKCSKPINLHININSDHSNKNNKKVIDFNCGNSENSCEILLNSNINSNNSDKMVAAQEIQFDNFDDTSEELKYGPGIVSKLRCRYLSLALRQSNTKQRTSLNNLRRATSLNNLLDDDDVCEDVCNVGNTSNGGPNEHSSSDNSNSSDQVNLNNIKNSYSDMYKSFPQDQYIPTYIKSGQPIETKDKRSRQNQRGNDTLKRARSVEALVRYDSKAWERDVRKEKIENLILDEAPQPAAVTIESKIAATRNRNEPKPPKKIKPLLVENERPPADLVKEKLRLFESTANRKNRSTNRTEVAARVATYKTNINTEKPALYPRPPQSPSKKPVVKARLNMSPPKSPIKESPTMPTIISTTNNVLKNELSRPMSPLMVDLNYRQPKFSFDSSNPNSPLTSSSPIFISPQLTPVLITKPVFRIQQQTTTESASNTTSTITTNTVADLSPNLASPKIPLIETVVVPPLRKPIINNNALSSNIPDSPITVLSKKFKSLAVVESPIAATNTTTIGGRGNADGKIVNDVIINKDVESQQQQHEILPIDESSNSKQPSSVFVNKVSDEIIDSVEEFDEDDGAKPNRKISKQALVNISKAGTTVQFKFTTGLSPLKRGPAPVPNSTTTKPMVQAVVPQNLQLVNGDGNKCVSNSNELNGVENSDVRKVQIADSKFVPKVNTNSVINNINNNNSDKKLLTNNKENNLILDRPPLTTWVIEKNLYNKEKSCNNSSLNSVSDSLININHTSTPLNPKKIVLKKTANSSNDNNTTMVFDFKDRKDIPDYIENAGVGVTCRRPPIPKGTSGYISMEQPSIGESSTDDDYWAMGPPSPCNVEFENSNIIIDGKSNIRNKRKDVTYNITFDDKLTSVFEYPIESSLMDEHADLSEMGSISLLNGQNSNQKLLGTMAFGSTPLGSYSPVKGVLDTKFELGVSRTQNLPDTDGMNTTFNISGTPSSDTRQAIDENGGEPESLQYLKPATDDQTVAWSEGTRATDLLF